MLRSTQPSQFSTMYIYFFYFLVPIYKNSDEGDTNMKHGHDYVDYDSPPLYCSKFLGVLKYCGFSLWKLSEASGPKIIILEKIRAFLEI